MAATRRALLASLAAAGYGMGRQIQVLQRDAAELVASRLDLLLAIGTPSLLAAMAAAQCQPAPSQRDRDGHHQSGG